jgi:hypothetical protein
MYSADTFLKWSKAFYKLTGGTRIPPKHFYEEVENSHNDIRKFIGGHSLIKEIELGSFQEEIPIDKINPLIDQLQILIPKFFITTGYNRNHFRRPSIEVSVETDKGVKKRTSKWGTIVSGWVNKNVKDEQVKNKINKEILASLGQEWNKSKTIKDMVKCHLLTDPVSFMNLGYYGPDCGSCFRQLGQNEQHKLKLATYPNSFVFIGTKGDVNFSSLFLNDKEENTVFRCWGLYNNEDFHLSNVYIKPSFAEGNAHKSIDKFFKPFHDDIVKTDDLILFNGIYQNNKKSISFFKKGNQRRYEFVFNLPQCSSLQKACTSCGKVDIEEFTLNGKHVCMNCWESSKICEYSGDRYIGNGVIVYFKGKAITVKKEIVDTVHSHNTDVYEFLLSYPNKRFFHKSELLKYEGVGLIDKETLSQNSEAYGLCTTCNSVFRKPYFTTKLDKIYCVYCNMKNS